MGFFAPLTPPARFPAVVDGLEKCTDVVRAILSTVVGCLKHMRDVLAEAPSRQETMEQLCTLFSAALTQDLAPVGAARMQIHRPLLLF